VLEVDGAAGDLEAAAAVVVAGRVVLRAQLRAAHVHAARVGAGDGRPYLTGHGLDREGVGVGPAALAQVHDRLARAVAGQLGLRAVGVEDPQVGHEAALLRL
jgi:hypothetical protein